jgi:hypothetical protein
MSKVSTIRGGNILKEHQRKIPDVKGKEFSVVLDSLKRTDSPKPTPKAYKPTNRFNQGMMPHPIKTVTNNSLAEQIKAYKTDQLLSNPGGDYIFLNRSTGKVIDPHYDHNSFSKRIGKDIDDAAQNFLNASKNLTKGAEFIYVDQKGNFNKTTKTGLMSHIKNFSQDMLSGVTFGHYTATPDEKPQGFIQRMGHFFKKVLGEALINDLVIGVPRTTLNIAEDVAFGTLNLMEALPDATIGNFKKGREITTALFDNGQVALDYLTDTLPLGEASARVQATGAANQGLRKLPLLYNLSTPENGLEDQRWQTVRNTPFRKAIESLGALFSGVIIKPLQITKLINPWGK